MKKFISCLVAVVFSLVPISFAGVAWRPIARWGGLSTAVIAGFAAGLLHNKIKNLEANLVRHDDMALQRARRARAIALALASVGGGSVLASFFLARNGSQGTTCLNSGVINSVASKPDDSSDSVPLVQEPKVIKIILNVLPQGNFFDGALPMLHDKNLGAVDGVTFFSQEPVVSYRNEDSLVRCNAALRGGKPIAAADFNAVLHGVKIRGDGHCAAHAYVFLKKYKNFSLGSSGLPYAFIATVSAVTKARRVLYEAECVGKTPEQVVKNKARILMNSPLAVPASCDYPDIPKPVDSCFYLDSDDIDAASELLKKKIIIWTYGSGSFNPNTFISDDELACANMQQYFHVLNDNDHWSVLMMKPLPKSDV